VTELYSHSRLSSFESCPRKFHYRYVERLPVETESIEAFAGKRVHEVLERLYKAVAEGRIPSLARVLERFRALWNESFDATRQRIVRSENGPEAYREKGERCLGNHYRRFYPFDQDETLGLEQRVTFSLDAQGAYRVQGVIDRVVRARDGAIEIHDFKTAQRVPRQQELDRDRQLALYQIGLQEEYGAEQPIRLVWHYLLPNQVCRSERTPEALAELRASTIRLIDRIRAEQSFEPRPGPLCGWCEYNDVCPASPQRRAAPAAAPPPPAGQIPLI
jgi:putative RecB family exonuclease